ncbi:MAG: PTS mannose transporter subunit IIA [Alysiella sp.]|uniref:PTS sugar transporter subunit IIA n=1 Tax=Alysiella sp. TaxID=1872483 RepID=UPI0026DD68F8|nr:PTS mannose transporter subunit IIA [Alysiella sp.]MDO4432978.1 PTS mannose transporter subunit IIA [Alysiella sp.]
MIGLLIITHETLGVAYTQLAQHIFPHMNFDHIRLLNVENTDDHENIIARAHAMLPEINRGKGVLILTDIFGATPCNAAMKMVVPQQSAMMSGLNAPMLIKALTYSTQADDLHDFVAQVKQAGINGIMAFME